MTKYSGDDPYVDAASGVLRNRFGLTGETALEQTEAAHVAIRSFELASGYYIAWENVRRDDALQASVAAFKGDTSRLATLIRDNISALDAPVTLRKV